MWPPMLPVVMCGQAGLCWCARRSFETTLCIFGCGVAEEIGCACIHAQFALAYVRCVALPARVTCPLRVLQVKRIHEYKRQLLNVLGIIWRYDSIKKMTPEQRKQVQHSTTCLLLRGLSMRITQSRTFCSQGVPLQPGCLVSLSMALKAPPC